MPMWDLVECQVLPMRVRWAWWCNCFRTTFDLGDIPLTLAIKLTLQCLMYLWKWGQLFHVVYPWVFDGHGHGISVLWHLTLDIWPWTWDSCVWSSSLSIDSCVACLSMLTQSKTNSLNRDDVVCAWYTFPATSGLVCVALRLFSTYIHTYIHTYILASIITQRALREARILRFP